MWDGCPLEIMSSKCFFPCEIGDHVLVWYETWEESCPPYRNATGLTGDHFMDWPSPSAQLYTTPWAIACLDVRRSVKLLKPQRRNKPPSEEKTPLSRRRLRGHRYEPQPRRPWTNLRGRVDEDAAEYHLDEDYEDDWTTGSQEGPRRDLRGRVDIDDGWMHQWSRWRGQQKKQHEDDQEQERNDQIGYEDGSPLRQFRWRLKDEAWGDGRAISHTT